MEGWVVACALPCVRKGFGALLGLTWDGELGTDADERSAMTAAFELADRCEARGGATSGSTTRRWGSARG